MKKRTIVVPKNKKSEALLDYDKAADNDLLVVNLSEEDFYALFNSGFFDVINNAAGAMIDDYEDESISDSKALEKGAESIIGYSSEDAGLAGVVASVLLLFHEAIRRKTSVNFFF